MFTRIFASLFFVLFALALPNSASAQEKDPLITPVVRTDILPCPISTIEKFADTKQYPGHWLWTADHAGRAPVNRAVRGSSPRRLSEYFRGVQPDKKYSDNDRLLMARARIANEASIAALAYVEPGTEVGNIPSTLPNNDYEERVLPITDDFESVVLPCGTVLLRGITSSSRGADQRIGIVPSAPFAVIAWYEKGVKTKDGTPGVRAFVTKGGWQPSAGPSAGVTHKIGVIDNCGNPFVIPAPADTTITVKADPPVVETPRPQVVMPTPTRQQLYPPSPTPTPTPAPPAPTQYESGEESGFTVTPYAGVMIGTVNVSFEGLVGKGDVPEKHGFMAAFVGLRFDHSSGVFVDVMSDVWGNNSTRKFEDITGADVTKKRDSDKSRNEVMKAKVGYGKQIAESIRVEGSVGYMSWCDCQDYMAQGAATMTERKFSGMTVGVGIEGHNRSERINVSAGAEFGFLKRESFTQQHFEGFDFPRVNHPEEDARSYGFNAEIAVKVWKELSASVGFEHLSVSSERTNTFQTGEKWTVNAVTVGMKYAWGKR